MQPITKFDATVSFSKTHSFLTAVPVYGLYWTGIFLMALSAYFQVRYQSRKRLAEQRPRVRGQFVRQSGQEDQAGQAADR